MRDDQAVPARVVRVSELNAAVRRALERDFAVQWIAGEVSNFTRAASGHWYFQLKDERAQVRCVMFRNRNQLVDFAPRDGMAVEALGVVTLYEARGDFQVGVEALREAGLGALFEAYERMKRRLDAEGLFADARKRALPVFPRCVGVVTSLKAAALRDVLTTLRRRAPHVQVILYPTPVQGEGAAQSIAAALDTASSRAECDVLILCRGGGSIEDLWSFNEEVVARAVAACRVPVVCGIGHETDFTIADFVADRRAPTPSAAAEMVAPQRAALLADLAAFAARLSRSARRTIDNRGQNLDHLSRRLIDPLRRMATERERIGHLGARLDQAVRRAVDMQRARLDRSAARLKPFDPRPLRAGLKESARRLDSAWQRRIAAAIPRLAGLEAALQHLNPHAVLERGFSITRTASGELVRSHAQLAAGARVDIAFAEGGASGLIESVRAGKPERG